MSLYSLSNVQMQYGKRSVLHISDLDIHQGEIFGLVGPSGAGKSTLLRLLAMLEAPTQGKIKLSLNGVDVSYQTASIGDRRQLAMVFQRPLLLTRSVQANVAYGLRVRGEDNIRKRVHKVLERVAMSDFANAKAHTLSGGEMQRVSIARALVLEPKVLLLDEPTANLDPYNVRLIEDLLHEQHEQYQTTIVLVTHNVFQAKRLATRVGLLLGGELVEVASVEQFFNDPQDSRTDAFISGDLIY